MMVHKQNSETQAPEFTVVLPTFNRSAVLARSIGSVLTQTFKSFEFIIVDDGSTDETRQVVSNLRDPRIQYVFQQNQGPSAARNTGVTIANGKYLTFLDSDDEASPQWLDSLVKTFRQTSASVI